LSGLARRYVQPLFEAALAAGAQDRVDDDLNGLDYALSSSPDFRRFLNAPTVDRATKRTAVERAFSGAEPLTLNFLRVVINKNRCEIFDLAHRVYRELLNPHRGIVPGLVETAAPVDDATFDSLKKAAEARFGGTIELARAVDPSLIGGVRVRVGNRVIDASVKGRLERLKAGLTGE